MNTMLSPRSGKEIIRRWRCRKKRETSPQSSSEDEDQQSQTIPGTYGLPIAGSIKDRYDYFVKEGPDNFFKKRIEKYNSTVFRVNLPPGPPLFPESQAIVLLDSKSFRVLFDTSKVEKRDTLTGNYVPSKEFFGGFRMLTYMDTSEENHAKLKGFCIRVLSMSAKNWLPEFGKACAQLWCEMEKQLHSAAGKPSFNARNEHMIFNFLCGSIVKKNPGETNLGNDGPSCLKRWLAPQLAPIVSTGLIPKILEEITTHAIPLPFFLVSKDYNKLYKFFDEYASEVLDEKILKEFELSRELACHNLLFIVCFNAFGGMMLFFPSIIRRIVKVGGELQKNLCDEVRRAVSGNEEKLHDFATLKHMPLVQSTVLEVLRMEPPVPFQYGRAREDFLLETHHGRRYEVKKGELLAGYQPLAMRDSVVFQNPHEFIPDRFLDEEGQKAVQHLFWSNGHQNEEPSIANKQCPGKEYVVNTGCMFVAHIYMRYDTIDIDPKSTSSLILTLLNKPKV